MARAKRPENETADETVIRHTKETISNNATRNEKVSFDRKMDNMVSLLALLTPLDEQISDLMTQKLPIVDKIQTLRQDMVKDCVHPYTHLVFHDDHVVCKFCDRRFNVVE